jgi:hypothetical protein
MGMSAHVSRLRAAVGHDLLLLPSVSVLPADEAGRVMLVRHTGHHDGWAVLGGAVEVGESPAEAANAVHHPAANHPIGSAGLLEALGEGVQPLGSLLGDEEQFSGLDAGVPVAGNDVGLYHQGHPGRQGEAGCGYRPARGRYDRREVAAAEAVHQVVDRGETCLLDDGSGGRKVLGTSARDQVLRDGVERGCRDSVEFGVQRRRGAPIVNVRSTWPAYSGAAEALISHVTMSRCRITHPVGQP